MIKVALVDDHVLLRNSLAILISKMEDFEATMQANNGIDFINQLKTNEIPDIVLLDITMPKMDGVETSMWLKQNFPDVKIIVLSMLKNELLVIRMLKNGAKGYLPKDCETTELYLALHHVYQYGYYHNALVTDKMTKKHFIKDTVVFNSRELCFMRWACTDMTHRQIAGEMNVSHRTIDSYRDSLFEKLNVNSRVGIVLYAIRNGFVQV